MALACHPPISECAGGPDLQIARRRGVDAEVGVVVLDAHPGGPYGECRHRTGRHRRRGGGDAIKCRRLPRC